MSRFMLDGWATAEGTANYKRVSDATPSHFRSMLNGLSMSSIGLGTGGFVLQSHQERYEQYIGTVKQALKSGVNVIDTASNYGGQLAEQIVGYVLSDLVQKEELKRNNVVVATKGGYLPFNVEQFEKRFIESSLCRAEDLVNDQHCIAPAFIENQIEQSRQNLRLETIDIYFLHNPEEQLWCVGKQEFVRRIHSAFEMLEKAVAHGQIVRYGFATAEGFGSKNATPFRLDEVLAWARNVAGDTHHFKVIQVPLNLGMQEVLSVKNHLLKGESVPLVWAAQAMGITVMTSVSIHRAKYPWSIPDVLRRLCPEINTDVQLALQFTRSAPGVTTALVGMSCPEHVMENLELRHTPPLDLLAPAGKYSIL